MKHHEIIIDLMRRRQWTQKRLAHTVGKEQSDVSRIINRKSMVRMDTWLEWCRIWEIDHLTGDDINSEVDAGKVPVYRLAAPLTWKALEALEPGIHEKDDGTGDVRIIVVEVPLGLHQVRINKPAIRGEAKPKRKVK